MTLYWETPAHKQLTAEASKVPHLRQLLQDRTDGYTRRAEGVTLDFSHEKVTDSVVNMLFELATQCGVEKKLKAFGDGTFMNETENRHVLHWLLRAHESDVASSDFLRKAFSEVTDVLNKIKEFAEAVRSGTFKGHTGKPLTSVVSVGIGGSYLGPEFVYEAMRTSPECRKSCENRTLRFLANVDPIDIARATEGLDPETTLVVIVSKTFTTAETMLNAKSLRAWLLGTLKDEKAIAHHMVGVTTNVQAAQEFGIASNNTFGFWDWVGGRFSVSSAVGCLPLALHFGFDHVRTFLDGCRLMDQHFFKTSCLRDNLPVLMALLSTWNSTYLGHATVAVLPYCQALLRFTAHIQQMTMESNGKRVTMCGTPLPQDACEVYFGEPGTNGQHSFYQLLHQGRVVPAEFIGFCRTQNHVDLAGEPVSNHDELMSNFFAQPDALALGKTEEQCKKEGVPEKLIAHKVFPGDRPSCSLLFDGSCDPKNIGILLALYEHRTAVQGFLWGNNSFDQWGVELGKVLAKNVRNIFKTHKNTERSTTLEIVDDTIPTSTKHLMKYYLAKKN